MTSTITGAVATLFLIAGVWAANVVCYHPHTDDLDPTTPVNVAVSWR